MLRAGRHNRRWGGGGGSDDDGCTAATVAITGLMAARREDIDEAKDDAVGDGEADANAGSGGRSGRHSNTGVLGRRRTQRRWTRRRDMR